MWPVHHLLAEWCAFPPTTRTLSVLMLNKHFTNSFRSLGLSLGRLVSLDCLHLSPSVAIGLTVCPHVGPRVDSSFLVLLHQRSWDSPRRAGQLAHRPRPFWRLRPPTSKFGLSPGRLSEMRSYTRCTSKPRARKLVLNQTRSGPTRKREIHKSCQHHPCLIESAASLRLLHSLETSMRKAVSQHAASALGLEGPT